MKRNFDKEQERLWSEEEAREKRERGESLNPKLAEQKARWERALTEKSAQGECVADGKMTREEINIKILDKVTRAYEDPGEENFDLYLLLEDMLHNTYDDPYKLVAYELEYSVGDTKRLLKEIVDEFDIPSYEEIQEREEAEEEARQKRERVEKLTPKLAEQKARWERVLAEKSAQGECVTNGRMTREEINIKILDKVTRAYEELGEENFELYLLLEDMLHNTSDDSYRDDPYKLVAYELRYSVGDTAELLKEIVDEFDIPSYEEIQEREWAEEEARREREWSKRKHDQAEEAWHEHQKITDGIVNFFKVIGVVFFWVLLKILFKRPPKNNSQ